MAEKISGYPNEALSIPDTALFDISIGPTTESQRISGATMKSVLDRSIYNVDDTLTGDRQVTTGGFDLGFVGNGGFGVGTAIALAKVEVVGDAGTDIFRLSENGGTNVMRMDSAGRSSWGLGVSPNGSTLITGITTGSIWRGGLITVAAPTGADIDGWNVVTSTGATTSQLRGIYNESTVGNLTGEFAGLQSSVISTNTGQAGQNTYGIRTDVDVQTGGTSVATMYGAYHEVSLAAGTSNGDHIAGYFAASGSTGGNNYGIIVPSGGGDSAFGHNAPIAKLHVRGATNDNTAINFRFERSNGINILEADNDGHMAHNWSGGALANTMDYRDNSTNSIALNGTYVYGGSASAGIGNGLLKVELLQSGTTKNAIQIQQAGTSNAIQIAGANNVNARGVVVAGSGGFAFQAQNLSVASSRGVSVGVQGATSIGVFSNAEGDGSLAVQGNAFDNDTTAVEGTWTIAANPKDLVQNVTTPVNFFEKQYTGQNGFDHSGPVVRITNDSPSPTTRLLHLQGLDELEAARTDGYSANIQFDPSYDGAFAVTRHNYMDLEDVTLTNGATVTDSAVMRFDAAAGTHSAVDAGTTKTSPGTVDAWVKININGTIYFVPAYTSKTT